MKRLKISATTSTGGDGTATGTPLLGKLYGVYWGIGTCATGVDITVSVVQADTAVNLLVVANADASKLYYPRTLEHLDTDGSNLATHTEPIIAGTPKLTIAQGGATKTGSVILFYED